MCDAGIICVIVDLGSMVADVMHPDLVSFQPCIDDFMDTVEAPALLRTVWCFVFTRDSIVEASVCSSVRHTLDLYQNGAC